MGGNDWSDWLFLAIALWVYFDATHHHVGKIKGQKGFLNMTAGGWATAASITYIGLIALVLYLARRNMLIEAAKTNPVTLSLAHRIVISFLLFILPMGLPYLLPGTPEIDAGQLQQLLR